MASPQIVIPAAIAFARIAGGIRRSVDRVDRRIADAVPDPADQERDEHHTRPDIERQQPQRSSLDRHRERDQAQASTRCARKRNERSSRSERHLRTPRRARRRSWRRRRTARRSARDSSEERLPGASPATKNGIHSRSSGSWIRSGIRRGIPEALFVGQEHAAQDEQRDEGERHDVRGGIDDQHLGRPITPMSTPASGGRAAASGESHPEERFAWLITRSSSPISSGRITFCAVKYGAPRIPSMSASSTSARAAGARSSGAPARASSTRLAQRHASSIERRAPSRCTKLPASEAGDREPGELGDHHERHLRRRARRREDEPRQREPGHLRAGRRDHLGGEQRARRRCLRISELLTPGPPRASAASEKRGGTAPRGSRRRDPQGQAQADPVPSTPRAAPRTAACRS